MSVRSRYRRHRKNTRWGYQVYDPWQHNADVAHRKELGKVRWYGKPRHGKTYYMSPVDFADTFKSVSASFIEAGRLIGQSFSSMIEAAAGMEKELADNRVLNSYALWPPIEMQFDTVSPELFSIITDLCPDCHHTTGSHGEPDLLPGCDLCDCERGFKQYINLKPLSAEYMDKLTQVGIDAEVAKD